MHMLVPGRFSLRLALALLALPLFAGLLVPGLYRRPATVASSGEALVNMDNWEISDLLHHLEAGRQGLRVVPTAPGAEITVNAFVTVEDRPWADLAGLLKDPRLIGRWKGIVFCEYTPSPTVRADEFENWGECGWWAPPFAFFGDPQLLAQIRAALAVGPPQASSATAAR
jgi:hypothetical protein